MRRGPRSRSWRLANPDVTDATLDLLTALPRLAELTVSDTAITDAGLAKLSLLPALRILRIARTQITPAGVQQFLAAPPPRLTQLDVSGCGIPTAPLRAWKNAAPPGTERRYVN